MKIAQVQHLIDKDYDKFHYTVEIADGEKYFDIEHSAIRNDHLWISFNSTETAVLTYEEAEEIALAILVKIKEGKENGDEIQ